MFVNIEPFGQFIEYLSCGILTISWNLFNPLLLRPVCSSTSIYRTELTDSISLTMAAQSFLTHVKSKLYHPKPAHPPQSQPQPQPESEPAATLAKAPDSAPILDNDDEAFLSRVMSESLPAAAAAVDVPVSTEMRDAQIESLNDATNTPLPATPATEKGRGSMDMGEGGKGKEEGKWSTKRMWGMLRRESTKDKGKVC